MMKIKCGIGFDAHKFETGRKLVIGGIDVPYEKGLAGYSDADVLIHAIIDSLAGPALGKDVGNLFPDNDPAYKDIDSKILLVKTVKLLHENKWQISHIDSQIIAQEPKMAPHIMSMRGVLASLMNIHIDDITIKATTTEKMGFTGRKEGIAALASAILIKE